MLRQQASSRCRGETSGRKARRRPPQPPPPHTHPSEEPLDAMASLSSVGLAARKRKRRRRQDRPPIAARLVLDDHVKGDVGIVSQDLFADLFPHLTSGEPCAGKPLPPQVKPTGAFGKLTATPAGRRGPRRQRAPRPGRRPRCPRTVVARRLARDYHLDNRPRHPVGRSRALDRTILPLVVGPPELRDDPAAGRAVQAVQP